MDISRWKAQPAEVSAAGKTGAPAAERDARLDPKLVAAAHQFEASLMQELLKPLSSGQLFGDEDEPGAGGGGLSGLTSSAEGSGSALMSFGSEALAKALSEKGGLGIARRILDHFESRPGESRATGGPAGPGTKGLPAGTGSSGEKNSSWD